MYKRAARYLQRHGSDSLGDEESISPRDWARRKADERIKAAEQKFRLQQELGNARANRNAHRILALKAALTGQRLTKKQKQTVKPLIEDSAKELTKEAPTPKTRAKKRRVRHPWCR
jgi:hypothetical protein